MSEIEIKVPNIGDFKDVEVIEVLVSEGQTLKKNDPLITIESDKSSVEIPSNFDGKIKTLKTKVGDKVSEGDIILILENINDAQEKVEKRLAIEKETKKTQEINLEESESSRVSDFPVRTYVSPVSRTTDFLHDSSKQQSTGNFNITPYDPERFLMVGSSRKMQLRRGFQINIETKGNTSLNAGDIVTCTLDINSSPDGDIYEDRQDRFFQGRFLVTAIRHTFDFTTKMHKSLLSLSKDSVGNKPLGSNFTETRPLTTGRIIKEFYDSSE